MEREHQTRTTGPATEMMSSEATATGTFLSPPAFQLMATPPDAPIQRARDEAELDLQVQGSRRNSKTGKLYVSNRQGDFTDPDHIPTKQLTPQKKLQVIRPVNDPEHLSPGPYFFVKLPRIKVYQGAPNQIDVQAVYGYVKQDRIKLWADYLDFNAVLPESEPGFRQGKIVPVDDDDPPISAYDVYQSGLSDCYLHAALIAAVDLDPALIEENIYFNADSVAVQFPGLREKGSGEPVVITMSRNLFFSSESEPLYGGKKDAYLWPAFFQKAWAIYKDGYHNIAFDAAAPFLKALTGSLTDRLVLPYDPREDMDVDKVWQAFRFIRKRIGRFPIVLTTSTWTDRKGFVNKVPKKSDHGGIGIKHVYAILDWAGDFEADPDEGGLPDIVLTVRDPRNRNGNSILLDISELGKGKFFSLNSLKMPFGEEENSDDFTESDSLQL